MRTLYLLRHAKSSWKDASLKDFDRPLKKRGREAAKSIGEVLKAEKIEDFLVITSTAVRARETTTIALKKYHAKVEVRFNQRIYEASPGTLLNIVHEIEDDRPVAMLVGHNPGFEMLLGFLTGQIHAMPTAALAKISFQTDSWKEVKADGGELERLVIPSKAD
jgi:phosphohistidine phosphatase